MSSPFGLRTQALLLSALLLVVPAIGYYEARHYQDQLIAGQRNALRATAKLVAATLSQTKDPVIVNALSAGIADKPSHNLYAYTPGGPVTLDGRDDDWQCCVRHMHHYGKANIIAVYQHYTVDSLSFSLAVGVRKDSLYLFMRVIDDHVVYRKIGSLSVHRNDHVQFATIDDSGNYERYTIAAMQPGLTHPFLITGVDDGSRAIRQVPDISAMWLATENGYNIEARIPLRYIGHRFSVSVTDVDNQDTREPIATLGSASTSSAPDTGNLLLPPAAASRLLAKLEIRHARLRLVDKYRRLVGHSGDIADADGLWSDTATQVADDWLSRLLSPLLSPLLPHTNPSVQDNADDPANIQENNIDAALSGTGAIAQRPSADGTAIILSAAWPINIDSKTVGAVVIDETTNGVIRLVKALVLRMLTTGLLVVICGSLLLVAFAALLSSRLRTLQDALESSTDSQGRIRNPLAATKSRDELGSLRNSVAGLTVRLQQHNQYLEDMSQRLAHELRTPVTVIRSSLDNLTMHDLDDTSERYVSRANEGVQRLASILTNMTEARRLEEAMNTTDVEYFDLAEVIAGCVQGYELAYPEQRFELSIENNFDRLTGLPELIAQMLDKLVSNAVEFSNPNEPVKIRLTHEQDAVLRVINSGPTLSEEVQERLFDSMISVRRGQDAGGSHLGLGLYIAKIIAEFHGGRISAHNREDAEGVIVTVRLPVMRITANSS